MLFGPEYLTGKDTVERYVDLAVYQSQTRDRLASAHARLGAEHNGTTHEKIVIAALERSMEALGSPPPPTFGLGSDDANTGAQQAAPVQGIAH
jgi:hypothetical protein